MLKKIPEGQTCGTCGYALHRSVPQDLRGQIECRARSPQMFVLPVQTNHGGQFVPASSWPVVKPDEWCGEWMPGPVITPANH